MGPTCDLLTSEYHNSYTACLHALAVVPILVTQMSLAVQHKLAGNIVLNATSTLKSLHGLHHDMIIIADTSLFVTEQSKKGRCLPTIQLHVGCESPCKVRKKEKEMRCIETMP